MGAKLHLQSQEQAMKIGHLSELIAPVPTLGSNSTGGAHDATAAAKSHARSSAVQDGAATGGASVSLSAGARSLATGAGNAGGDYDAAKVEAMKHAIANGSYKVDHAAIADKLLANAQEIMRKVGS
jgi:negative regulator of flagellin synthesis FlgM